MKPREITNPFDIVTIDYSDVDAARVAVIMLAGGAYGIMGSGSDEGMPLFANNLWVRKIYGSTAQELADRVGPARIVAALQSVRCSGTSPAGNTLMVNAHMMANGIIVRHPELFKVVQETLELI